MLWLSSRLSLSIGRLGQADCPRGYYSYVGSAKRGLSARLHRHVHGATTRHWHLDYLRPHARVLAWRAYPDDDQPECELALTLLQWGQNVIPRFGASDCSCPAHLLYYPRRTLAAQSLQQITGSNTQWYGGTRAGFPPSRDL